MKEQCRVSIDELNHDHKCSDVDECAMKRGIMERADQIMGNTCLKDHEDRDFMREMLIDNDGIMDLILDMGWKFQPNKHIDSDVSVNDVRNMAVMVQEIVNELQRMAIAAAREE